MRAILKYAFLVVMLFYLSLVLTSPDVRYELPSVLMFMITLLGFVLTATKKGQRKVRV